MYYFSIGCIFKNEAHGLYEFLEHYLYHGIDHIYLINDFSSDNYMKILQPYIDKKIVSLFQNDIITKDVGRQSLIYNKYFKNILKETVWLGIFDLDEYLYSNDTIDIKQILYNYNDYNSIIVEWIAFGGNNCYYQPFSIVDGFNKHNDYNINLHSNLYYSYKCILKADDIISIGIHSSEMKNSKQINLSYTSNINKLFLNHYQIQSVDFYLKIKCTRGDVNNWLDHVNLERNLERYNNTNSNCIENNILREQNFNIIKKVKEKKIMELNDSDVTVVITSCNRPLLLEKTLNSFFKYNTYPIKEIIIIDDYGLQNVNDFVLKKYNYNHFNLLYNKKNIGQVNSIDIAYRYVTTKYIFHCEEDWEFLKPGFIEVSMNILEKDAKIFTVWLRPHNDLSNHPVIYDIKYDNYYKLALYSYIYNNNNITWCGFTFNPGLRRTSDVLKYHPYNYYCEKDALRNEVTEYEINVKYKDDGYYGVITDNISGYCTHIGYGYHVLRKDEI